jgi:signal transduction histidine kinase
LAGAALLICLLAAVGWYTRVEVLTTFSTSPISMKVNTALAYGVLAAAYLTANTRARRILLSLVLGAGLLIVIEYALGADVHIDQVLIRDWTRSDGEFPGRPALTTGVALAMLASAGWLIELRRSAAAQLLTLLPLLGGCLGIYGHIFSVPSLYDYEYAAIALPTAITTVLMSGVTLISAPRAVTHWIMFGKDPGAALQRLLIPVATFVIPAGGWLAVTGWRDGLYEPALGAALLVMSSALMVVGIALWAGRLALRIDDEREELIDQLGTVNHQLEDRVRVRSHQLNRQRTKLVLLEERDRIARDLHDRVIQRIFAAGLQISSLGRNQRKAAAKTGSSDVAVADSLDVIAIELDLAIRELRNSIFELTSIDDHEDIDQVVRDIVSRAARILGFMPRVDVSGQIAGIRPDLVAQLASVIQEGLSNVARHANASAAEVTLSATEEHLQVCVADNGTGMPEPLPRSSGISNLMSRARNLGGTATWTPNSPEGTVFVWRVPREVAGTVDDYGNDTPVAFSESSQSPVASTGS